MFLILTHIFWSQYPWYQTQTCTLKNNKKKSLAIIEKGKLQSSLCFHCPATFKHNCITIFSLGPRLSIPVLETSKIYCNFLLHTNKWYLFSLHIYIRKMLCSAALPSSIEPLLLRNGTEVHIMKRRHAHFFMNYLNPFWFWKLKSKPHCITWWGCCLLEEQKCSWGGTSLDHVSERILCQDFTYIQSYIPLKVVYMWVLQMTFGTNMIMYTRIDPTS